MTSVIRGSDNMDSAQVRPVLMTEQAASGTSVDFTGIPDWVNQITVTFFALSTSGTSVPIIQLGDADGIETTGYTGATSAVANATPATTAHSSGVTIYASASWGASVIASGQIQFTRCSGNAWVYRGGIGGSSSAFTSNVIGYKELSSTLDRIRITTAGGTDTFDAGTISVIYE